MVDRRPCRNPRRDRRQTLHEAINQILIDCRRLAVAGRVRTEPGNLADIDLGRRALVSHLREMRRNPVHLIAERTAAKALEHPRVFEI